MIRRYDTMRCEANCSDGLPIVIDRNDNVWVTDVALNQVFKFSHDGRLLLTLGERGVGGKVAQRAIRLQNHLRTAAFNDVE